MIDVSMSATIDRPVGEVFEFVAAMENEPQWHTDILKADRLTEGEVGTGTRYRVAFRPQPMSPSDGTVEIVDLERNRRIVSRLEMERMTTTLTQTFEETGDGTRVTRRIQIETSGLMAAMSPVMRVMVRRRNVGFLENLKRVLES